MTFLTGLLAPMSGVFLILSAIMFWPMNALSQESVTAVIIDTTGVETEVTELKSDVDDFAGYRVEGRGLSMGAGKFKTSPHGAEVAEVGRWVLFSQIASVSIDVKGAAVVELKSGTSIKGRFVHITPFRGMFGFEHITLRGKFGSEGFELSLDKVRSLKIKHAPDIAPVARVGTAAVVELRNGEKLAFSDLAMHPVVGSGYSNVSPSEYMDPFLWLKTKRGQGFVKLNVAFEKIARVDFDKPLSEGYEAGNKVRVSLRDGRVLSGACGGDGAREACDRLAGTTDTGLAVISGELGYAVTSMSFAK